MTTNTESGFPYSSRFRSLPDGRRVFLAGFPWLGYYVVPDHSIERQLFKKVWWEYSLLLLSLLVIAGLLLYFHIRCAGALLPLLFFIVSAGIRSFLYENELGSLQKIDFPSAYSTSHSELRNNLRTHSENSFPNYEISILLDVPGSQDKILMLKYTEPFSNVLRCHMDGSIVWQAELPPVPNDVYTNIEWKDQKLHAFSRSCRSVLLNENTGRILSGELEVE